MAIWPYLYRVDIARNRSFFSSSTRYYTTTTTPGKLPSRSIAVLHIGHDRHAAVMSASHHTHTARWLHGTHRQLRSLFMHTTQRWPSGSWSFVVEGGLLLLVLRRGGKVVVSEILLLGLDEGDALGDELLEERGGRGR